MSKTYDKDGALIEQSTTQYTLSYSKKLGDAAYGNEEVALFSQITIEPGDSFGEIEKQLEAEAAFVKQFVLRQLGVQSDIVNGVVQPAGAQTSAPKAASANGGSRTTNSSTPAATTANKNDAWQYLLDHPEAFFDNRSTKVGKQPDWKGKRNTPFDGVGLWLDSKATPQWAKEKLSA